MLAGRPQRAPPRRVPQGRTHAPCTRKTALHGNPGALQAEQGSVRPEFPYSPLSAPHGAGAFFLPARRRSHGLPVWRRMAPQGQSDRCLAPAPSSHPRPHVERGFFRARSPTTRPRPADRPATPNSQGNQGGAGGGGRGGMAGCVNNTEADGLAWHGKTVYDADGSGGCSKHPPGPDHNNLRERLPMARKKVQPCKHCGKPIDFPEPRPGAVRASRPKYCSKRCRIYSRIEVRGSDECWHWQGAKHRFGYGLVNVSGTKVADVTSAHSIAWEIANNTKVPQGMYVCHACDNPPCCNPAHLWLGTPQDNYDDMIAKGRHPNCR
jgi:hypothetical protein